MTLDHRTPDTAMSHRSGTMGVLLSLTSPAPQTRPSRWFATVRVRAHLHSGMPDTTQALQ